MDEIRYEPVRTQEQINMFFSLQRNEMELENNDIPQTEEEIQELTSISKKHKRKIKKQRKDREEFLKDAEKTTKDDIQPIYQRIEGYISSIHKVTDYFKKVEKRDRHSCFEKLKIYEEEYEEQIEKKKKKKSRKRKKTDEYQNNIVSSKKLYDDSIICIQSSLSKEYIKLDKPMDNQKKVNGSSKDRIDNIIRRYKSQSNHSRYKVHFDLTQQIIVRKNKEEENHLEEEEEEEKEEKEETIDDVILKRKEKQNRRQEEQEENQYEIRKDTINMVGFFDEIPELGEYFLFICDKKQNIHGKNIHYVKYKVYQEDCLCDLTVDLLVRLYSTNFMENESISRTHFNKVCIELDKKQGIKKSRLTRYSDVSNIVFDLLDIDIHIHKNIAFKNMFIKSCYLQKKLLSELESIYCSNAIGIFQSLDAYSLYYILETWKECPFKLAFYWNYPLAIRLLFSNIYELEIQSNMMEKNGMVTLTEMEIIVLYQQKIRNIQREKNQVYLLKEDLDIIMNVESISILIQMDVLVQEGNVYYLKGDYIEEYIIKKTFKKVFKNNQPSSVSWPETMTVGPLSIVESTPLGIWEIMEDLEYRNKVLVIDPETEYTPVAVVHRMIECLKYTQIIENMIQEELQLYRFNNKQPILSDYEKEITIDTPIWSYFKKDPEIHISILFDIIFNKKIDLQIIEGFCIYCTLQETNTLIFQNSSLISITEFSNLFSIFKNIQHLTFIGNPYNIPNDHQYRFFFELLDYYKNTKYCTILSNEDFLDDNVINIQEKIIDTKSHLEQVSSLLSNIVNKNKVQLICLSKKQRSMYTQNIFLHDKETDNPHEFYIGSSIIFLRDSRGLQKIRFCPFSSDPVKKGFCDTIEYILDYDDKDGRPLYRNSTSDLEQSTFTKRFIVLKQSKKMIWLKFYKKTNITHSNCITFHDFFRFTPNWFFSHFIFIIDNKVIEYYENSLLSFLSTQKKHIIFICQPNSIHTIKEFHNKTSTFICPKSNLHKRFFS